jgi:hypothetical protein
MVGAANNRNVGHHGLALQPHGRESLGSHRVSCRVERVGSLDRSLVALDRGHRSVDGGGFFAFAYKRTARPVTLFQRVRWGRGSDWYRYVGFSVVDSPPDEKRVSPETAPALGRHPAHGRFPSCISYLWNESRQRAQTFPKKSERPAEKPHRPSPTRLSIAGEPL